MDERRNQSRYGFRIPAHILLGPQHTLYRGYVMNMSDNGAFIMMDRINLGPRVWLRFKLTALECEGFGHVARVMNMGNQQGLGVELTNNNDDYYAFIARLSVASAAEIFLITREMKRITVYADDPANPTP